MSPSKIVAVAVAEMRSARRLVRTWIFSLLAIGLTFIAYLYYAGIHAFASRFSATIGATGPRFLMSAMGIYLLAIFLVGIIFLGFDVRARDQRERIVEVIESRPVSNLELLVGRWLGLTLVAWTPVLVVAVLVQGFGGLAHFFDWPLGDTVQPVSLVGFVFVDALTALVLWCATVILLAVTLRNRLLVTVVAFVLLGLQVWSLMRTPIYLLPAISALSGFGALASDVLPQLMTPAVLLQRSALWALAAGMVVLASALHPRPDAGRGRRLATGGGLVAIAVAVVLSLVVAARGGLEVRDRWAATHAARQHEPRADVIAIEGSAVVTPGRRLDLDLQITLAAPEAAGLDEVLLTLNPGLEVSRLEAGGTEAEWEQRDGLLTVRLPRPLAPAAETTIHLVASGAPDPLFAFLDSAKRLENGTMVDGQLAMLGTEAAIFARRYVALTPGIYWLPGAGAALPSAEPSRRPLDHYRLDLEVDVPAGWLVAGPGLREPVAGGSGDRYRFRPAAPVPEVGLIAARLERFATEIEGVEVELLLHRKHLANVELFADAADEIRDRAAEIFRDAARYGVPYPYRGLSLVEAPSQLRAYGGGWRMDSVQAMPGIMLIREHSFPTASFEFAFRNPERFEEQEGGLAAAKAEVLETFFENDFSGGNPFLGVSRNFLQYVTSASGEGATALDFVCQELVNQLLMDRGGFFSPYLFDFSMSTLIGETITEMISGQTDSVAQALLSAAADRPSVWDRALGVPLAAIEGFEEPKQAVNVLALKGRAIARSILDGLGREGTAALLAELRRRHAGGNFTAEDLTSIAADLGTPLTPIVGNWLHETSLPGFLTSPVTVARLDDDDQGRPRYQARLSVFNGETTPGVFRLRYATGEADKDADWHDSEPIRLGGGEAVEVGLLAGDPVRQLWLQPYLSLNRNDVRLDLPEVDEEARVDEEPFRGTRPSDWRPRAETAIVVDDLDPGFTVESEASGDGMRLGGGLSGLFAPQSDMDQGLPAFTPLGGPPRRWSRREEPSAFGEYRHTIAIVRGGDGSRKAVFEADLPNPGKWRLEFHVPVLTSRQRSASGPGVRVNVREGLGGSQGTYAMTLDQGGQTKLIEFDGSVAEPGWNRLGEFDLAAGDVRLVVSDETSGRVVLADAIRWVPPGES